MPVNENDPRVKRTRELLMKSFMELLEQRQNIHSISVQEIADGATLNRATFYAHYADKNAFLEFWMRDKFRRALETRLPHASIQDIGSLRTIILTVFDFFASYRKYRTSEDNQLETLFAIAMQKEFYQLLTKWLSEASHPEVSHELLDATALCVSWGIFGPAVQWSRSHQNRSAEAMVKDILVVVAAGLAPVIGVET